MTSQDNTAALLVRFPGPVTLYPSRKKWMMVLLICVTFVAIAIWILLTADPEETWKGWLALVFFGAGTPVAITVMLPGAGSLVLDKDGFVATQLYKRHVYLWRDCSDFTFTGIPPANQEFVVFNHTGMQGKTLAEINVKLTGRDSSVPDTCGLGAEELANLMNEWRDRAVA